MKGVGAAIATTGAMFGVAGLMLPHPVSTVCAGLALVFVVIGCSLAWRS